MQGYPGGSVVGFAPDQKGRPLFSFSSMSSHTQEWVPMGQEKRLLAQHLKQPDSTLLVPRLGIVEYNCGVIM